MSSSNELIETNELPSDELSELIRKAKFRKCEYMIKIHRDLLLDPLFVILKMIKKAGYFPKALRTSRLTFLPTRCIFSLDAITKIVESSLALSFNKCVREHYKEHGDPHQMAYEPGRGTTSCNLITYSLCDIILFKTKKPIAQIFADLVKAFNKANRSVMLCEIQRIAGAGDICRSRFQGRVYTFEDMVRGQNFNRGVDPGSPISVVLFKLFMNTDVSLTSLNDKIVWASCYSDDRAPIIPADDAVSGVAQEAFDGSTKWSEETACEYHGHLKSDGSANKKGPKFLEFKKRGMASESCFSELSLSGHELLHTSNMRELGLNVSTDKNVPKSSSLLAKHGYFFRPENERLCAIAYRIQDVKYDYPPKFLQRMVSCYFNGIVRFGSCLYMSRCLEWEINRLRFYYAMAVSAVLRINALDVLGPTCCRSRSVTSSNNDMKRLLRKTGFPSLLSMAQTDAVATVRQVHKIWPAFFENPSGIRIVSKPSRLGMHYLPVSNFSKEVIAAGLPSRLSNEVIQSESLIGDVTRLAWQKIKQKSTPRLYTCEWFEFILDNCLNLIRCEGKIDYSEAMSTYQKLCLEEFGALEIQDRRSRFLDEQNRLIPDLKCSVAPPDWNRKSKEKKKLFFGCTRDTVKTSETDKLCDEANFRGWCRICGYWVHGDKFVTCKICKKASHVKCVDVLRIPKMSFKCSRVNYFLGRDAELLKDPGIAPLEPPVLKKHRCLVCGENINARPSIACTLQCSYRAHVDCIKCLEAIIGASLNNDKFKCNDVIFQMRPEQVLRGQELQTSSVVSLRDVLKLNGKVNTAKYTVRTKRWLNEEVNCRKCHRWYGLNETDHHATYCTGIQGTPLPRRDTPYMLSRCKRFRHISWKTP